MRKNAVKIFSIDSVTTPHFFFASYNHSQIPAIIDLLKSPNKPDEQYVLYPRVLFPDHKVAKVDVFRSGALLKVSWLYPIDSSFC